MLRSGEQCLPAVVCRAYGVKMRCYVKAAGAQCVTQDQALAQSNAKEIDLLVTWLFRLTQEYYNYKMAAVLGIMVFIVCAVFTVVCFHFINKKEATFS